MTDVAMIVCRGCGEEKPKPSPRAAYCETCRLIPRQRWAHWRNETPEKNLAMNLRRYGITPEEYERLRAEQDYRCAVCLRHEDELPHSGAGRPRRDGQPTRAARRLTVDHCHTTGRIRGLLCLQCNSALAVLDNFPGALERAIRYLGAAH